MTLRLVGCSVCFMFHVKFATATLRGGAGAMLKARHAAERLQNAWHGGLSTIDQLRASMQTTLAEFVSSHDEPEVRQNPRPWAQARVNKSAHAHS